MNTPTAEDTLLTADQVATRLGVSRDWVYRLYRKGDLKGRKLGRRTLRFHPDDLRRFIDTYRP